MAGGAYLVTQDDDDSITADGEVFLELEGTPGPDAFIADLAIAPTPPEFTGRPAPGAPTTTAGGASSSTTAGGAASVPSASGATPGLYGGTRDIARCDPAQLRSFLASNPDEAAAWVAAQNADPSFRWSGGSILTVADLDTYLGALTPITLLTDTRVTNHGFANGQPTPRQSVLQAGTAVLVDDYGVPRAKCACGNPLVPPAPVQGTVTYTGPGWDGFDPATTVVVQPAPQPVDIYILISVATEKPFARPAGTTGAEDADAEDIDIDRPDPPVSTTSPTTTSSGGGGGGSGAYCDAWDDLWTSTGGDLASLSIQELADVWRDLTAVAPPEILPTMQEVQVIWDRGVQMNTNTSLYDSSGPEANAVAGVTIYVDEECGIYIGGD